jgi:hypothetical protein
MSAPAMATHIQQELCSLPLEDDVKEDEDKKIHPQLSLFKT